jgi:exopolysaccharide production protein ExoY
MPARGISPRIVPVRAVAHAATVPAGTAVAVDTLVRGPAGVVPRQLLINQAPTNRAPTDQAPIDPVSDDPLPHDEALLRACDIVGACLALVLALPAMALIALAVRLTSPGPVLFAHRRVGRGGRRFDCLKFRTMMTDADAQLRALLDRDPAARAEWQRSQKLRRDPRVSPIGRFLRRTSLDELPQLFNVLSGEMSLVGPRPIVEAEIARYGRHFAIYCRVRPGVTGLWQVQRDGETTYRRRVAFDVAFARGRSLRLYFGILARTVPAVLIGRGAW